MTNQIDAIDMLLRDHHVIQALAEQLDAADEPTEIRGLFLLLVEQLSAHEAVEHELIFPALPGSPDDAGHASLEHRMGEHEELNELLAEMRSLPPDSFAFTKRASAFVQEIEEHFQREEETVFPRLRESFSREQLIELADRASDVREHSPAFPDDHPRIAATR